MVQGWGRVLTVKKRAAMYCHFLLLYKRDAFKTDHFEGKWRYMLMLVYKRQVRKPKDHRCNRWKSKVKRPKMRQLEIKSENFIFPLKQMKLSHCESLIRIVTESCRLFAQRWLIKEVFNIQQPRKYTLGWAAARVGIF